MTCSPGEVVFIQCPVQGDNASGHPTSDTHLLRRRFTSDYQQEITDADHVMLHGSTLLLNCSAQFDHTVFLCIGNGSDVYYTETVLTVQKELSSS